MLEHAHQSDDIDLRIRCFGTMAGCNILQGAVGIVLPLKRCWVAVKALDLSRACALDVDGCVVEREVLKIEKNIICGKRWSALCFIARTSVSSSGRGWQIRSPEQLNPLYLPHLAVDWMSRCAKVKESEPQNSGNVSPFASGHFQRHESW